MKVILKMIKDMEKEYINTIMEIYMMEIGNAELGKDGEQ